MWFCPSRQMRPRQTQVRSIKCTRHAGLLGNRAYDYAMKALRLAMICAFAVSTLCLADQLWREGKRMGEPLKEFNKSENVELKGKFEVFRPADNSILISEGKKYQTIFLGKDVKMTRGDKEVAPQDLKKGEMLSVKATKTQGKVTASEVVAMGK